MGFKEETTAADPLPNRSSKEGKEKNETKKKKNRRSGRRWKVCAMSCFQVSCFGTTTPHGEEAVAPVAAEGGGGNEDAAGNGSKAEHSGRFWMRKARRTVPVDSTLPDDVRVEMDERRKPQVETERGCEVNLPVQAPVAAVDDAGEPKPSPFLRLFAKFRRKKTGETGLPDRRPPEDVISAGPNESNADVRPVRTISLPYPGASRMSADHRPGSQWTSDPAAAAAATTSSSSSMATVCPIFSPTYRKPVKPTKKSRKTSTEKEEPEGVGTPSASKDAGLIILMLLLLSLIVGGRAVAIVCTCTCFYLMPSFRSLRARRRPPVRMTSRRSPRKGRGA